MNADGLGIAPFAIENGVVKMLNARIAGANIDDLFVRGEEIEPGAVTQSFKAEGGNSGQGISSFNLIVNHGLGSPTVKLEYKCVFSTSTGSGQIFIHNLTDNIQLESVPQSSGTYPVFSSILFTPPADRLSTTFQMLTNGSSSAQFLGRSMFAYIFKR